MNNLFADAAADVAADIVASSKSERIDGSKAERLGYSLAMRLSLVGLRCCQFRSVFALGARDSFVPESPAPAVASHRRERAQASKNQCWQVALPKVRSQTRR